jgi:hypothetical protein
MIVFSSWGAYMDVDDWMRIYSSAARISDPAKIPQALFDMVSDVDYSQVAFGDHMLGTNDVKGYLVTVVKPNLARLEVLVNLSFKLINFKVWFPGSQTNYGITNFFQPSLSPKSVVDTFWEGGTEEAITWGLDILVEGRLDNDKPLTGEWGAAFRRKRKG